MQVQFTCTVEVTSSCSPLPWSVSLKFSVFYIPPLIRRGSAPPTHSVFASLDRSVFTHILLALRYTWRGILPPLVVKVLNGRTNPIGTDRKADRLGTDTNANTCPVCGSLSRNVFFLAVCFFPLPEPRASTKTSWLNIEQKREWVDLIQHIERECHRTWTVNMWFNRHRLPCGMNRGGENAN